MYTCSEHFQGQFEYLGDALGADCVVQKLVEAGGRLFPRAYSGDGFRNEDWYGWHLHIGAWRDGTPLQIRWDQSKMQPAPEFRTQKPAP
jgi:hypothetical protein